MSEFVRVPSCSYRDEWVYIVTTSGYWFTRSTMSFFSSRVLWQTLIEIPFGFAFITSEQNGMTDAPRRYTIRTFSDGETTGHIDTIGEFQQYASRAEAIRAMRSMFAEVIG